MTDERVIGLSLSHAKGLEVVYVALTHTQYPKSERKWIGSYVSCQGTRILEQTMQVARHIRCIVLRSSTEVARSCRRSTVARFTQYGDCIRLLLPRLERTPLPAARQWRYEASAPRSTSCLTRHTSASPDKCCQRRAVAQRLSTITPSLSRCLTSIYDKRDVFTLTAYSCIPLPCAPVPTASGSRFAPHAPFRAIVHRLTSQLPFSFGES
jgi:hypothetical protein